jgi:hypothetical protein
MKKLILFATLFLAFMLAIQLVNAFGLSVLPVYIKMNVIRGQRFNLSISVYNPGDEGVTYSIKADDKIANWVSFYIENQSAQINQISVPPTSSSDFIASFKIPKDVPNGKYLSTINVGSSLVGEGSENTSSLSVAVPISVSFQVEGSQFLTGKVISITTTDTEINRLLRIKTEFQNTGDVIATPRIEFVIIKNGALIANFVHNTTSVYVDNTSVIITEWDTTGQTVGDYVANVKVYLNVTLLKEENLNFKILERGTLTAEGKIEEVTASNEVITGQPARIEVQFQNTGQIDLIAKISGEVYQNNNLVNTLQSDETLIKVGENGTLTAYFKPTTDGSYLIKSNVAYEGKKKPISDISINATGPTGLNFSLNNQSIIIIIFVIFAFFIILFGIYKARLKSVVLL